MKKFLIAAVSIALSLGFAECKKNDVIPAPDTVKCYPFTIEVDGDAKAGITPEGNGAHAQFKKGDVMYVAYKGKFVGSCKKYNDNGGFSASNGGLYIDDTSEPERLELYYLAATQDNEKANGNNFWTEEELWDKGSNSVPTTTKAHVPISKQNVSSLVNSLPIIAYGKTKENFNPSSTSTKYTATLHHKCALVKFEVDGSIPADADVFVDGLNNMVYAYFTVPEGVTTDKDGFLFKSEAGTRDNQSSYSAKYKGEAITSIILPYRTDNVCYAILLPQNNVDFKNGISAYYYVNNTFPNGTKVYLDIAVTDLDGSLITEIKEGEFYKGSVKLKQAE